MNAALLRQSNAIKTRHTANTKERLEEAHKLMVITNQLSTELKEIFNQSAKIRITDFEVKKLIQMILVSNKEVLQNILNSKFGEDIL